MLEFKFFKKDIHTFINLDYIIVKFLSYIKIKKIIIFMSLDVLILGA